MFLLEGLQAHNACALTNVKQDFFSALADLRKHNDCADINAFPLPTPNILAGLINFSASKSKR
jgi:hypothetical protein